MAIQIRETLVYSMSEFWARKTRSLITIFGILLGTMSIMVVMSLTRGMQEQSENMMMELGGANKVTVRPNWNSDASREEKRLTIKQMNLIYKNLNHVVASLPVFMRYANISRQNKHMWGRFMGVTPESMLQFNWDVETGRQMGQYDIENATNVIMLGSALKQELFGNSDAVGHFVTVKVNSSHRRLQVIAVLKERWLQGSSSGMGGNSLSWMNTFSFCPFTTFSKKIAGNSKISRWTLIADSLHNVPIIKADLEKLLFKIKGKTDLFRIETAADQMGRNGGPMKTFSIVFIFISIVSLLVGGIVIMNIMLASIQEKTREIGIKLSIGAQRIDIFWEFLIQTMLTTFVGGVFGVIVGYSLLNIVADYLKMTMSHAGDMALIGLLVASGVGMLFGIFPSIKAANLDPVKALRNI